LTAKQRERFFLWIMRHALKVGIGIATPEEVDSLNVRNASILSMRRAVSAIQVEPDLLIIDGREGICLFPRERCVVKGDRKCFFVATASIVAKVVRDRIMDYYHTVYPCYDFKRHKGYKTALHVEALRRLGPSPIHRKSFRLYDG
jgi:ribonuclease HII